MDNETQDDPIARVRDELDRRGWSQRDLADHALVGESTVFRLLKGDFTTKTLRKVERALDLDSEETTGAGATPVVADIQYGGYLRELYAYYEGEYACVRVSFADPASLTVYPMEISWCDSTRALVFHDRNPGYEQQGIITVPTGTQFVHFLTLDRGSARLITAYHMPSNDMIIRAMIMTFANPHGRKLQPAAAPLIMIPLSHADHPLRGVAGLIARNDPRASKAAAILDQIALDPVFLGA